jgi:hypothetical protein
MRRPLRTAEAPLERPSSASEGSSRSDEEPRVFQKATVTRQKSHGVLQRKTSMHREQHQLSSTAESKSDSDPPKKWIKRWRKEVKEVEKSDWCQKALKMIENDRMPDLDNVATLHAMETAYRYGLTAKEAVSIFLYTSALYKEINPYLREDGLHKPWSGRQNALKTMIAYINGGLSKLPQVTDQLVRVVRLEDDFGQKLQVGKKWREPAFGSCVRASHRNMKWDGNYDLLIQRTSGAHDVSAFSDASNEGEVLVEPGRKYRIVARDETGERVKLELSEIDPKQKST